MSEWTSEVRDGMRIDWDVPIPMDDGLVLRADVYRPTRDGQHPVILTYGPYGKWLHFARETNDLYACIEWAAAQPWSSGKIGLNGISYYAMNQWQVAALQPPHLAAICVWEGAADYYRDLSHHGGILCTFGRAWFPSQVIRVQHGRGTRGYRSRMTGDWVSGPPTLSEEELGANRRDFYEDCWKHPLASADGPLRATPRKGCAGEARARTAVAPTRAIVDGQGTSGHSGSAWLLGLGVRDMRRHAGHRHHEVEVAAERVDPLHVPREKRGALGVREIAPGEHALGVGGEARPERGVLLQAVQEAVDLVATHPTLHSTAARLIRPISAK